MCIPWQHKWENKVLKEILETKRKAKYKHWKWWKWQKRNEQIATERTSKLNTSFHTSKPVFSTLINALLRSFEKESIYLGGWFVFKNMNWVQLNLIWIYLSGWTGQERSSRFYVWSQKIKKINYALSSKRRGITICPFFSISLIHTNDTSPRCWQKNTSTPVVLMKAFLQCIPPRSLCYQSLIFRAIQW